MIDDKSASAARSDRIYREKFIAENISFILSCASRASGRWIDVHNDLYSEALIAFNSAIDAFSSEKGNFKAFAERVIANKIIDCLRKEDARAHELPFSSLSAVDEEGEEIPFEIADESENRSVRDEILALERELSLFSLTFAELPDVSPKTQKAKKECRRAVKYIISDKKIISSLKRSQKLPIAELLRELDINKKMLERYRKYIIVGVLICSGDYGVLNEYFWG